MARRTSRPRISKSKPDPLIALALSIVPSIQIANDQFEKRSVSNHKESDQRHTVRSGQKDTVRRLTHIDKLHRRRALTKEQANLCQWYADQHEAGFATVGCTANYCGAGGGGFGSKDLSSRYASQASARDNYRIAREAIQPTLRALFERVVIDQIPLMRAGECRGRLGPAFRMAVRQLEEGVGHMLSFE